jgi:NADPH2 dehydrogenase
LGRAAKPGQLAKEGVPEAYGAPSPIPLSTSNHPSPPHELTVAEIQELVQLYATAAENAIKAGFDGVEVHGANGYLVDQFLQDVSNKRTDAYGGSVENRVRFAKEIVDAVVEKVGAKRAAIRLSPWSLFQGSYLFILFFFPTQPFCLRNAYGRPHSNVYPSRRNPADSPPRSQLRPRSRDPRGWWLHTYTDSDVPTNESNDFIRDIVREKGQGTKFISAGGYTRESAIEAADVKGDFVAFGRWFLANVSTICHLILFTLVSST